MYLSERSLYSLICKTLTQNGVNEHFTGTATVYCLPWTTIREILRSFYSSTLLFHTSLSKYFHSSTGESAAKTYSAAAPTTVILAPHPSSCTYYGTETLLCFMLFFPHTAEHLPPMCYLTLSQQIPAEVTSVLLSLSCIQMSTSHFHCLTHNHITLPCTPQDEPPPLDNKVRRKR